jgi:hypothetical protein
MSTATDMLAAYLDAEAKILKGKTARIGDRLVSKEDLAEIRAGRREWEERVNGENAASTGKPHRKPIQVVL